MGKDMLKTNIDWESTIKNANARANGVAGRFTDPDRHKFLIENEISTLVYDLKTPGGKQVAGLYNAAGRPYIENTMDASIVDAAGNRFSAACSPANGRMNSHRIGYYYYDFRFRDQGFVSPEGGDPDEGCYDILANTQNWGTNDVEATDSETRWIRMCIRRWILTQRNMTR